ncbi:hypothetical protein GEMRC1_002153 [Eukaryota sp. GEM-RC1]
MASSSNCCHCSTSLVEAENVTIGCCNHKFCSQTCWESWVVEFMLCPKCEELLDWSAVSEADEQTRSAFISEDLDTTDVSHVPQTPSDYCDVPTELEVFQIRRPNEFMDKSNTAEYGPPKLPYDTIKQVMLICINNVFNRVAKDTESFHLSRLPALLDNVSYLGRVSKRFLRLFQQTVEIFCYNRTVSVSSSNSTNVPILTTILHLRQNPLCPVLSLPFDTIFLNMFFDATLCSVSSFPSHLLPRIKSLSLPHTAKFDFLTPHDPCFCRNLCRLEVRGSTKPPIRGQSITEAVPMDLSAFGLNLALYNISIQESSVGDHESFLTDLSFVNCSFNGDVSTFLTNYLATNTRLKKLSIKECHLSQAGITSVIEGLSWNTSVTYLDWEFPLGFDYDEVNPIHNVFRRNLSLSRLSLKFEASRTTIQHINESLESGMHSSRLERIDLYFCKGGTILQFASLLSWLMCQKNLKHLHIDMYSHASAEGGYREPMIIRPNNLKYLSLRSGYVNDLNYFMCDTVFVKCPNLQELDLSYISLRRLVNDVFASVLLSTSLVLLNLSHCNLKDREIQILASFVLQFGSLRLLNLKHNPYSITGHTAMIEASEQRKRVKVLRTIDVVDGRFDQEDVEVFNQLLILYDKSDQFLTEVKFTDCSFYDQSSFTSFISRLRTNEFIKTIVFSNPTFSFDVFLLFYDNINLISHIDITLQPYRLDVSSGLLGFAGSFGYSFPLNMIEILVSRSIKVFDCSKATFPSVSSDLQFGLNLLKASVCSFPRHVSHGMV